MRLSIYALAFSMFMILLLVSCESVKQPKPKAQLLLQYPQPKYKSAPNIFPFDFEYNDWAQLRRTTNTAEGQVATATLPMQTIQLQPDPMPMKEQPQEYAEEKIEIQPMDMSNPYIPFTLNNYNLD